MKNKIIIYISIFFISFTISMPLVGYWLGSLKIYIIYLLAIFASWFLFWMANCKIIKLDLFFLVYIASILFSALHSEGYNYTTELFFVPLIVSLYFGAKAIIKLNLLKIFMNYITAIFLFFSFYLIYQLALNGFNYNIYYHFSDASNKVEYLTMTLYASIIFFYLIYLVKSKLKYILMIYILFLIIISGARFSILFIVLVLFLYFFKSLKSFKILSIFIFIFSLVLLNWDYISNINLIKEKLEFLDFTLQRLSNLDIQNASIQGRIYAITQSIYRINENPILGYGLNSSPVVINFIYPHNMFLEIWLDGGIFGLLSLLFLNLLTFYVALKIFKDSEGKFLVISFIYLFFAHLKSFSIYHSPIFFVFISFILTKYYLNWEKR